MNNSTSEQYLRELVQISVRLENTLASQLKFIGSLLFINTGLVGMITYMAFGPGSLP